MADRAALKAQVMATHWADLAQHFARGGLLVAASDQDLLDAAAAIADDDTAVVEKMLEEGSLRRASDQDAKTWNSLPDARFQFLVLQPFVLTQLIEDQSLSS